MTSLDAESFVRQIVDAFRRCLPDDGNVDEPLDSLLRATRSRAIGLWKRDDGQLVQMGFRAVPEMAQDVQTAFAHATRRVSLEQASLGIVKAVLTDAPTIATIETNESQLGESASWLSRFEARNSLAVPIHGQGNIVGVLAISSATELLPESEAWQVVTEIAAELGGLL